MAQIFNWLQLCHHPCLTRITQLNFFSITVKIKLAIPQNPTFDSQMLPPTQSCSWFLQCSCMGATLRNATTLPDFLCTRVALQNENNAVKKCRQPWWQPDHRTRFKTTHGSSSLHQLWQCTTPCHYHGSLDPQIAQQPLLKKNTHIHLNLWSVWISKFQRTGKNKKSRAIFDPVNSGLSLPWLSLNVSGREHILV